MIQFTPPPEPPDFPTSVATAKNEIEGKIKSPGASTGSSDSKKKVSLKFPDLWKKYKAEFSKAQFGKCGYCEILVIVGQPGDIEHYAPKGEVWEYNPQEPGEERPDLATVAGRKPKKLAKQGYWWLAYEWSNYLLSCIVCNQYWKGAIFPVAENVRKLPPVKEVEETPLLLNPFRGVKPADHLSFTDFGQIEARDNSPEGLATITTCGLDRESLIRSRKGIAKSAYQLARELSEALDQENQPAIKRIFSAFLDLGNQEAVHSGMVRIIFEEQCGITWDQLEFLAGSS
ncbi:MAG TPA: hypothetical protein VLA49_19695 [Anaerolineales bacterium]|nr:hypothetical protein [Anaerolineales bacterium]